MIASCLLALLSSLAPALPQQPAVAPVSLVPPQFRGVHVDRDAEADTTDVAIRAETYKLRIEPAGATFIPLLGPRERSHPLRFRLTSAAVDGVELIGADPVVPRAFGDRVVLDHGAVQEWWSARAREAEQSFVVSTPAVRTLRVRIRVEGDLPVSLRDGALVFHAGTAGGVEYRDFVVVDAKGRRVERPIALEDGAIVLQVAGADLSGLEFPLTLDPIVRTFGIEIGATASHHPDVAFDSGFGAWAVVYTEEVANNDSDIMVARFDSSGNFVSVAAVDSSTRDSVGGRIAHDRGGHMFLCVWRNQDGTQQIRGRRLQANSFALLGASTVSPATSGANLTDPGVGGSNAVGSDRFLIVWGDHGIAGLNSKVEMANFLVVGGVLNQQTLDPDTLCTRDLEISVSKSAGPGGHWAVVYRHKRGCASLNYDIAIAAIRNDGVRAFGPTLVQNNGDGSDDHPDVAGDGNQFFVVFDRDAGANGRDLVGAGYRRSGATFTQTRTPIVLSAAEPGVTRVLDQTDPSIDFDGCRFTYVYLDGSPVRLRGATFMLVSGGASVSFQSGAQLMDSSATPHSDPSIAFVDNATIRCLVAWEQPSGSDTDIRGTLLDATAVGVPIRYLATGCGPMDIAAGSTSPVAGLGVTFRVAVSGQQGLPSILVGLPTTSTPLTLCPTVGGSCRLGLAQIFDAVPLFTVAATVPCDPGLIGFEIAFQGLDVGAPGGCTANQFGFAFTATRTLIARIL